MYRNFGWTCCHHLQSLIISSIQVRQATIFYEMLVRNYQPPWCHIPQTVIIIINIILIIIIIITGVKTSNSASSAINTILKNNTPSRSGGIASFIRNIGIRWIEWSASSPGRFDPGEGLPVPNRTTLSGPQRQSKPAQNKHIPCPPSTQSLNQLHYSSFYFNACSKIWDFSHVGQWWMATYSAWRQEERQSAYNVTLKGVRATIVSV